MSFILDALKKSENERQRQAGPALATLPTSAQEVSGKKWLTILVITMAVVIAILAIMLVRSDAPPRTRATEASVVRSPRPAEAAIPDTESQLTRNMTETISIPPATVEPEQGEVRSLRDEVRPNGGTTARDGAMVESPSTDTVVRPLPASQPTTSTVRTNSTDPSQLPTARDLVLKGVLTGPPLHLDLHIYSDEPARRSIFVNGMKYREGDQIRNGPRVREIVPEGAVLDDGGQLFLLDPD